VIVVYPKRLVWQSVRVQTLAIGLTWIYGFSYIAPTALTGSIIYNADNQICQLPLELSFLEIYGILFGYTIPISLIIFIYFKLVRYVKQMGKNVTTSNNLVRAKRELQMVRRTVILVTTLLTVCFPFTLILFMGFFNHAPKYHFRIAYIFVDGSVLSVMISLFQFTDPLKASIMKRMNVQLNVVGSTTA
jgi:hypothetical protein